MGHQSRRALLHSSPTTAPKSPLHRSSSALPIQDLGGILGEISGEGGAVAAPAPPLYPSLSVSEANMVVYVHPCHTKNVSQAILRELSSLLFKFNETFDGVVLAYSINDLEKVARILSGVHPYFGVKLKAQILLFSPKPDMQLEGKVVKVTRESIHTIILGFSSAVIPDKEIRDEFRYKRKHGESLYVSRSDKHHVIKIGTMIRFVVKSLDEEIMHMCGSLIPAHTGSVGWLDGYRNTSTTDRSKKRAEADGDVELQDHKSKKHRY